MARFSAIVDRLALLLPDSEVIASLLVIRWAVRYCLTIMCRLQEDMAVIQCLSV